jgi:hypothetical protein
MRPERCRRTKAHGPHYVKARNYKTGFRCDGREAKESLPPAINEHLVEQVIRRLGLK